MAERLRAELGDGVTEDEARGVGPPATSSSSCRTTSAASACTSTPGSPSAPCTSSGKVGGGARAAEAADGLTYEQDGATWLRTEELGDQRDRVLVKSDGSTTYLCNDLAYHLDKVDRGWEHLIDIWGADHHGQVKSVQVGMQALGVGTAEDPEPEIILGQFVTLVRDGETVRLSKRTGNIITLADILDEVDPDVARLDVPAAEHRHDADVRPRHRHVAVDGEPRLLRAVRARAGVRRSRARRPSGASPAARSRRRTSSLLVHERELDLLRSLAEYPEVLERAPRSCARRTASRPGCASSRHGSTASTATAGCITDDAALTQARLWLTEACRIGLADALGHPRRERARGDGAARRRGRSRT